MASFESEYRRPTHLSSTIPDLTDKIIRLDSRYCAAGGFGDVYRCRYTSEGGVKEVAVKAFRFGFSVDESKDGGKSVRMIRRELEIWRRLSHPNIVPFLGIAYGFGLQGNASLVSMWMPHGTLHTFLKAHNDRLVVAHRLQLLLDIANGLDYLHLFPMVHGDLSSSNVLVDHSCNACLTDFGCASLVGELPEGLTYLKMTNVRPGNLRWAAPEHFSLDEQETKHTTKSDIYSLGHIALLVLSGKYPWSEIQSDASVVRRLFQGLKPGRPLDRPIDDKHWALIEQCWSSIPERPLAKDVVSSLEQFLRAVQVSGTTQLAAALSQNRSIVCGNTVGVPSRTVSPGKTCSTPVSALSPDQHIAVPSFRNYSTSPLREQNATATNNSSRGELHSTDFTDEVRTSSANVDYDFSNLAFTDAEMLVQVANAAWSGTFNGTFPNQAMNDVQIHVVGTFNPSVPTDIRTEIRTDLWPKSFTLNPLKDPLKDVSELSSWCQRHQSRAHIMQFKPDPRAPDGPLNEQRFIALNKFMMEHRIFTYAGWQLPSGKFSYNIFIFPMLTFFAGAVFPDGLPDLPGSGNALDIPLLVAEANPPQVLSGFTFPPALMARIQGLEPAKQRELLAHFIRLQQQERLRLQQTQQARPASGQVNLSGMSIPPNPLGVVPSVPPGLHANVGTPAGAGAYNAGGGTSVNFEMMQSFMRRSADGSTPQTQGMKSG